MHYVPGDSEPDELLLDGPLPPALTVPRSYVLGFVGSVGGSTIGGKVPVPAARALLWVAHLAWCGGAAAFWLGRSSGDRSLHTRPVPLLRLQSLAQEPPAVAGDGGRRLESWQWAVGGAATGLVVLEFLSAGRCGQDVALWRIRLLGRILRVVTAGCYSTAALLCQRLPGGAEQQQQQRRRQVALRAAAVLQLAGLPFAMWPG